MKKSTIVVLVAVAAILLVSFGFAFNNQSKSSKSRSAQTSESGMTAEEHNANSGAKFAESSDEIVETDKVVINDFKYAPAKIKIKKGTTVTWTNEDSIRHDVMPDSVTEDFKPSELLAKGESYSWTFNTVGTFAYHCSPHPYMKGTVEVVE